MYVASKYGKVFHNQVCNYTGIIKYPVYFYTSDAALNSGYRFCACCSPLKVSVKKAIDVINALVKKWELNFSFIKGLLYIHDGTLGWFVIRSSVLKKFVLFHENGIRQHMKANIPSYPDIKGYHKQKYTSSNLVHIFRYIGKHKSSYLIHQESLSIENKRRYMLAQSRVKDPQHNISKKKRFKRAKKARKLFNKMATLNVLEIIESISGK